MTPASPASQAWHVVCLCAAWCGVCRDWQPVFRELAGGHPDVHFAWIDVEDEDDAMGEVEVETFPTLLIAQGSTARFFGPVPPSGAQLARLLATLQVQPDPAPTTAAPPIQALLRRLTPLLPASRVVTR